MDQKKIIVLYDGACKLCLSSKRFLEQLDWFNTLEFRDFQDDQVRETIAPNVTFATLDKAMHIKKTNGTFMNGFDAFRHLMWRLPLLSIVTPFMYLPGIPYFGRRIYAYIALQRKDCTHEHCAF